LHLGFLPLASSLLGEAETLPHLVTVVASCWRNEELDIRGFC